MDENVHDVVKNATQETILQIGHKIFPCDDYSVLPSV